VREIETEDVEEPDGYLGEVEFLQDKGCPSVTVNIRGQPVRFKMDSGADVSVVGKLLAQGLKLKIQPTEKVLFGPGRTKLDVEGVTTVTLHYKDKSVQEDIYILPTQNTPLLSRGALLKLDLLTFNVNLVDGKSLQTSETQPASWPQPTPPAYHALHPVPIPNPYSYISPTGHMPSAQHAAGHYIYLPPLMYSHQTLYGQFPPSVYAPNIQQSHEEMKHTPHEPSLDDFKPVDRKTVEEFRTRDSEIKTRAKRNFDVRKGVKELPVLHAGDQVWVKDMATYGTVKDLGDQPRSYLVTLQNGTEVRRNRWRLFLQKPQASDSEVNNRNTEVRPNNEGQLRRSTRTTRPPSRYQAE